jgi:alkylhydroperoxidase family enzyme
MVAEGASVRITVPEGANPVVYATMQVGSAKLTELRQLAFRVTYLNDSSLTPREREMIRMRSVYHASCSLCSQTRAARDIPGYSDEEIPEELYDNVMRWRSWPGYTDRERLAIEFCERYTLDYQSMCNDDEFWSRLQANFSETEIGDLCLLCGHWDAAAKMFHLLLGLDDACDISKVERGAREVPFMTST